ncbi:MAG: tetratricopeptide repeat protein [Clostridia bacterium]
MIEKIIFSVLAIGLFTITFLKLVKKNDGSYLYMLSAEFIGIVLSFIELSLENKFPFIIKLLIYMFSIILPIIILWLEKYKKLNFPEVFNVTIAKILQHLGKEEKAKRVITNFLNKNKNSYISHKLLAQIHEKQENYEAAISEYTIVTELNRNDIESKYKLSFALNKNKQNEEAIIVLQEVLKQKPQNEKASNLLGDILFEEERYKEAISVYMTALRYHPASYDLYYNLGMTYTMINDFKRAKEFYEKAAEINSMAYNAKLNLGQIALIYGDLEQAEKYFMNSLKSEDLEAGSYYYLSQIALLKGDKDKARNYMNVAVELDPKVYKQAQKDPVFEPIREEIEPPKEKQEETVIKKKNLTKKEKEVNKHLMKTCILVKNLSNEDIQIIKNNKETQIKEDRQKE